ncbi:ABC transporter ATP-binding protein [candidate division WOR-3 bacterium]|jgi:ABC-2 type transport system ATP-binding protein|nr:ABC transporter ATP-binding protein [candidate division WOR-3 bacterium]
MIELQNVTRTFGKLYAVKDLNLKIPDGELFTLLGPNGAGKTTTVKMITGLIKPSVGKIFINGIDVSEFPEKAKEIISYIPDQPFLYPELTGREFIIFVSRLYRMEQKDITMGMESLIDVFRIGDWIDLPASMYSHGMRQKVIFIQALIHNPEVIVIDEPMVGLDPVSARIVKKILRERVRNGVTVFMSTHSLDVAEEISDRVGVIDEGKLIEVGSMEKLLKTPSSTLEDLYFSITEGEPNVP